MRIPSRSLLVVLVAALGALIAAPASLAFDEGPRGTKLEGDRKKKMMRCVYMLQSMFSYSATFESEFGSGATDTGYTQTNSSPTSLQWGFAMLRHMISTGRLREHALSNRALTCRKEDGAGSDRVLVNSETIDEMCDKPLGGEDITTDPCQAAAFMFMAASLMNELIHVYQVAGSEIPGNDAHNALVNKKRCDAEKDSDCASIIVINKFIDNLTKPDPNDPAKKIPHTSLNDISGDPSYISFMTRVLTESNIDTPAEIAEIVEKLLEQLAEYENRKNNLFAAAITLDINWGPIYRNGWDGEPLKKINKDASGTFVFPIDPLLPPTHFQTIPAGNLFQSRMFRSQHHEYMLVQASTDPIGQAVVQLFQDTDGDRLPEQPEIVPPLPLPLPPQFGFQEDNFGIYLDAPPELHPLGSGPGILFHDQIGGTIVHLPLDEHALPAAPPQVILSDPQLTAGAFSYFVGSFVTPAGLDLRMVFSSAPDSGQLGESPAIWFDIPIAGGPVVPFTAPGQTLAESNGPYFPIGVSVLEQGMPNAMLSGAPGDIVDIFSAGLGAPIPLTGNLVGPDGDTGPLPLPGPLQGPDLMIVTDSVDTEFISFLPTAGLATDSGLTESNLDADQDRWDLSIEPPRLHFLEGVPAFPGTPVRDYVYEALLPLPEIQSFALWDDIDKQLMDPVNEVDIQMTELNLVAAEPIVVVSDGWDLALGANITHDGVGLLRFFGSNDWQPIFVEDFSVAPVFHFQTPIPALTFIPSHYEVLDIDLANGNDVVVFEFNGPGRYCYTNDGAGTFTQTFCPVIFCEGDANADNQIDVNDISYVLFRLGNVGLPGFVDGDANGDGVVDVNDISYVLFRLGNPC